MAVEILEASKDPAPNGSVLRTGRGWVRRLRSAYLHLILEAFEARREIEANSSFSPFAVFGNHIFGYKVDRGGTANEFDRVRAGLRCAKCEVGGAVCLADV